MVSYDHYRTSSRPRFLYVITLNTMKLKYHSPQTLWDELEPQSIICDSYNSGIDDYDYVDVNLNN